MQLAPGSSGDLFGADTYREATHMRSAWIVAVLVFAACEQGSSPPAVDPPPTPLPPSACATGVTATGALLSDGRVRVTCAAPTAARRAADEDADPTVVDVSAPIFPKVLELYQGQGEAYPTTAEGQAQLVHDSAIGFAQLLAECAPDNPDITPWVPGDPPLTAAQAYANYRAVEDCAYERYTVKPYWIPQLVQDVDVCTLTLGARWRTPTVAELAALGTEARQALADSVDFGSSDGAFYWSQVYARNADGVVQSVDLSPAAVGADPVALGGDPRVHFEGTVIVRCLGDGTDEQL
jgi:hypothetical protein